MKKETLYVYTGDNGTITTPVYFENMPYVKKVRLLADFGKILTNGEYTKYCVIVPESKVSSWTEIEDKGQE